MPLPDAHPASRPAPTTPGEDTTGGRTHMVGALIAIALGSGVLWWTAHSGVPRSRDGDNAYIRERIAQYHSDKCGDTATPQELCRSTQQIAASFDHVGDGPSQRAWNRVSQQECTEP